MEEIEFNILTNLGDLDFTNKNCAPPKLLKFEREADNLTLSRWVRSQLSTMERIFPSARIYFLIPSEYYDEDYDSEKWVMIESLTNRNFTVHLKSRTHAPSTTLIFYLSIDDLRRGKTLGRI